MFDFDIENNRKTVQEIWGKVNRTRNVFDVSGAIRFGTTGDVSECGKWLDPLWGDYVRQSIIHEKYTTDQSASHVSVNTIEKALAELFITACSYFRNVDWDSFEAKDKGIVSLRPFIRDIQEIHTLYRNPVDPQKLIDLWRSLLNLSSDSSTFGRLLQIEGTIDQMLLFDVFHLPTGICLNSKHIDTSLEALYVMFTYDDLDNDMQAYLLNLHNQRRNTVDVEKWDTHVDNLYGVITLPSGQLAKNPLWGKG